MTEWLLDVDRGEWIMPPLQAEFLEWLVDPARSGTQAQWAEAHGVHRATVFRWKRDARFRDAVQRRLAELNVDPLRIQEVIDAMHREATSGSVQAANLYLQYVKAFTPRRQLVVDDERDTSELSDEELERELEAELAALRSRSIRGADDEG